MIAVLMGILLAAEAAFLLPCLYLLGLTLAGMVRRGSPSPRVKPATRFAVLVPAHNEEVLLPRLLDNLKDVDYPAHLFDVYVVADNCTDSTADIARASGVHVLERHDTQNRGKGYALRWLLEQVEALGRQYDAYLVLDADSLVSSNFLGVMDAHFQRGSLAVQGYYTVSNATQTSVSALRYIALVLMHYVRPMGRRALGLSCGLFGTGMAFSREVISKFGWDAFTLAEDVEYYLKLTEAGIRVDFAPDAVLWAEMPASFRDARSQNLRWERGRLVMAWRYGWRCLARGMLERNTLKMDAAIEQLIPPLSITFLAGLLLLALGLASRQPWNLGLALAGNLALAGHLFLGLLSARVPLRTYRALALAPRFVVWKLLVYVQAMKPSDMRWTRTQRTGEQGRT